MNKLFQKSFKTIYFFTWPLTGIILHNSRRVRVLVEAEDSILLQRSTLGRQEWSLPGGGVGKNENPMQAAVRETAEEVGVKLAKSQLICIGEDRLPRNKHWPRSDTLFYVAKLPKIIPAQIIRPLEIIEVGWFKKSSLPQNCSPTVEIALDMQRFTGKLN